MIGTGGKEVATSDILLDVEAVVPLDTGMVESDKAAMKKEMNFLFKMSFIQHLYSKSSRCILYISVTLLIIWFIKKRSKLS